MLERLDLEHQLLIVGEELPASGELFTDLPFDQWPGTPVTAWRELSDAVLAEFRPAGVAR